jgi:hemerythrin-like domain-containing protein
MPGLRSPDAGFEAPFDLLAACHERVQRSLQLLRRLLDHLDRHGADAQAQSAASDVWRYFEIAAPAHHSDEELHLLPVLRASGDASLIDAADRIHADHEQMDAIWRELGPQLRGLADGQWAPATVPAPPRQLPALRMAAEAFVAIHAAHVPLEDQLAFPAARMRLDAAAQQAMGEEMAARRRP